MADLTESKQLDWQSLSLQTRECLTGKLCGLWGAVSDDAAFNSFTVDKQQALMLLFRRLHEKGLWHLVKQITNVYGEGGVGLQFLAWPMIESTLARRRDFTRLFANHKDTSGGFYEKERRDAVLHFLYQDGDPRIWYVHFDLHSPVHSPATALKHLRYEFLQGVRPDWKMISKCLNKRFPAGKVKPSH